MSQIKIIIASVLKPLKDPRAYYRFGQSLRETNKYQINIIGFSSKNEASEKNIKFNSIFSNNRKAFSRLLASFRFLRILKNTRPQIMIISTWELLPSAILAKLIFGGKIIYDVQENYIFNLKYNQSLKGWKKKTAVIIVNAIEKGTKRFVDHYIFSEHCYITELKHLRPFSVLENKFFGKIKVHDPIKFKENQDMHFLISGTITPAYGILEAVKWFKNILPAYPSYSLNIIGHVTLAEYRLQLEKEVAGHEAISMQVSDIPVDYQDILEAYKTSDIVLMPYWQVPSIVNKIPSKFFECMAMGKPALFSPNPFWTGIMEKYPAGTAVDFKDLANAQENLEKAMSQTYFIQPPGEEVLWNGDQGKFLQLIAQMSNTSSQDQKDIRD